MAGAEAAGHSGSEGRAAGLMSRMLHAERCDAVCGRGREKGWC